MLQRILKKNKTLIQRIVRQDVYLHPFPFDYKNINHQIVK